MPRVTSAKLHWNYFLALEQDLDHASRYVEFCEANMGVFSIELAHLLFAASSEVDVVAKRICECIAATRPRQNIEDYRKVIMKAISPPSQSGISLPDISKIQVRVPRYGLTLTPWANWGKGVSPDWWRSYNKVKHNRDQHFNEATLQNALDAMGSLLILNFYFYRLDVAKEVKIPWFSPKTVMRRLDPPSVLLRLPENYYDTLAVVPGSLADMVD